MFPIHLCTGGNKKVLETIIFFCFPLPPLNFHWLQC